MFLPPIHSQRVASGSLRSRRRSSKIGTKLVRSFQAMGTRTPKGNVAIEVVDNRYRLRWSYFDEVGRQKRFTVSIGSANGINRSVAERLARQIELDIASGNFDYSLKKYKQSSSRPESISAEVLIDQYIAAHFKEDQTTSLDRYRTLRNHFAKFQRSITVEACTDKKAVSFVRYLQATQKNETVNMNLTLLRAIWRWAIKKGVTHANPWLDLKVETEHRQRPKPFSSEEIAKILEAFKGHHYENFVRFLFGVGCRIGEAAALDWSALNDDCSEVWIKQSYNLRSRQIKNTKTGKDRYVPIPPKLQAMLQAMRKNATSDAVFLSHKGLRVRRDSFRRSYWKPALEKLGIEYRSPYKTRHTRWSHELSSGNLDLATAAEYAGNTPRTLSDRYYGSTNRPRLTDLD
ncbi:tyrosine-type recombinase/integrase [Leptolyngbya sp. FACHB-17]|uniref:tyrosine-type recombinase/integrase n=1 Tax=unclassified Leptolyngbya TaxID=2650499 RepID=UPI001680B314|nr:tyrosine-type recombinase/integrase [Leptolyngbya sp. FACHB-17]MBD2078806.1 tyrosine-type recombinase/integrase [Leptolyngbya sp. FACHB-17]